MKSLSFSIIGFFYLLITVFSIAKIEAQTFDGGCYYYSNGVIYCADVNNDGHGAEVGGSGDGSVVVDQHGDVIYCGKNRKSGDTCREVLEEATDNEPENPNAPAGPNEPGPTEGPKPEDTPEGPSGGNEGNESQESIFTSNDPFMNNIVKLRKEFLRLRNKKHGIYQKRKGKWVYLKNWRQVHSKVLSSLQTG